MRPNPVSHVTSCDSQRFAGDPAAFEAEITIPSARGPARFGDVMADFQRERFAQINPALAALAEGEKPPIGRHFWEATKGASKDSDLAVCLLWLLAFSRRPLLCQVGAADAGQAGELRKAAKDILRLNDWLAAAVAVQTNRLLCQDTESVCEIVAADVAGSHGARPDVLVINELSHITKREFAENLMDNAAKVPNGLVVIATNAGFLDTWQYEWREQARESRRWQFHQRSEPSPWLDPAEIEEARRRNSPARFNRLWQGVWSLAVGNAIPADQVERAITLAGPLTSRRDEPHESGFVAGLDLAVRRDHAALTTLNFHASGRISLADCESWSPLQFPGRMIPLEVVKSAVLHAHRRFRLTACVFDPSQGWLMAQQLRAAGIWMIPWEFTPAKMDLMAHTLLEVFSEQRISLYNDRELIRDLGRLQLAERPQGWRLKAVADETGHADRAFAMAIALPHAAAWCYQLGGQGRRVERVYT
jgi:hypothetical protein